MSRRRKTFFLIYPWRLQSFISGGKQLSVCIIPKTLSKKQGNTKLQELCITPKAYKYVFFVQNLR